MTQPIPFAGYRVVLADPPWLFELRTPAGEQKSPQAQYGCMSFDQLVAFAADINLDFICAPDSVLVMWATFPLLDQARDLMRAWGFSYKTGGAWAKLTSTGKPAFGTGYIYRSAAELWLLGVRGAPVPRSRSVRNLIMSERREHSRKPDEMHRDIEALHPGPYLELFARRPVPGWDAFGNEIGGFVPAAVEVAA